MTKQTEATKLALKQAFDLGQTYWSWADSEYQSHWKKADAAKERFNQLVEDTISKALAAQQTDWEAVAADQAMTIALLKAEQPATYTCGVCGVSMQMEQPAQPQQACHSNSAESETQNSLTLMDDMQAQPQQEPVMYDKTEMNFFAQNLYDQKMREGKRGHYESMFHVIHQCIKKVAPAQPQQEPVAVTRMEDGYIKIDYLADPFPVGPLYVAPLQPAPEQEPVAWATSMGEYAHIHWGAKRPEYPMVYEVPLYTSPPASKPWVGLTEKEVYDLADADPHGGALRLYRAIEAKLREKNA